MIYHNAPMSEFTTWRTGGIARQLIILESNNDIIRAFEKYPDARILGNGSNLLVLNNVETVVKLGTNFLGARHVHSLAREFAKAGESGLEFVMGIPASLGGAIKTNAGGKYGSMENVVEAVQVFHHGSIKWVEPKFRYRASNIQGLVLSAKFKTVNQSCDLIYSKMRRILREKNKTQPLRQHTAGCVFKNFDDLPAGQVIEEAGLSGTTHGGARVSEQHGNFIIAQKGCPPQDVWNLIDLVRRIVFEKTGRTLELEVEIW